MTQRVLVISLLRLGDILQHLIMLKGIEQLNLSLVTFVIFKEFIAVKTILENAGCKVLTIDREAIGIKGNYDSLVSLYSNQELIEWCRSVQLGECYSKVINATHTRLSAFIAEHINADDKRGLLSQNGQLSLKTDYSVEYFDTRFSGATPSSVHYVEALSLSLGFGLPKRLPARKTQKLQLILLQVETSDIKKSWNLKKFKKVIELLQAKNPQAKIQILCSDASLARLNLTFDRERLFPCSIDNAFKILEQADLLISVDTSIKHLAVLAQCPVVEIGVGSADIIKTGAFSEKPVSAHSKASCYPCQHSKNCPQSDFLCHLDLQPEDIISLIDNRYQFNQRDSLEQDSFHRKIFLLRAGISSQKLAAHEIRILQAEVSNLQKKYQMLTLKNFDVEFRSLILELIESKDLCGFNHDQKIVFSKKYSSKELIVKSWQKVIDDQLNFCLKVLNLKSEINREIEL